MRITEGKLKGKKFKAPSFIRPTQDKVRKAIFDVLKNFISLEKKLVLDLYAGSGGLGFEALSRGAKKCDFVEKRKSCCKILKENIKALNIEGSARIFPIEVKKFISTTLKKYDLILADPPYEELDLDLLKKIASLLKRDGIFVLEYSKRKNLKELNTLKILESKKYGDTMVAFLTPKDGKYFKNN